MARGKMHLLTTGFVDKPSSDFRDIFSECLLCGACEEVCSQQLSITKHIREARGEFNPLSGRNEIFKFLACKTLSQPALLKVFAGSGNFLQRFRLIPADSGLHLKLGLLEENTQKFLGAKPKDQPQSGKVDKLHTTAIRKKQVEESTYFIGCFARHLQPSILKTTKELIANTTEKFGVPSDQRCCGLAASSAGDITSARRLARHNIRAFEGSAGPIITSCGSCFAHLKSYPDLLDDHGWHERACRFTERVQELTTFLLHERQLKFDSTSAKLRIFYHDPCHLRFRHQITSAPREVLDRVGGVTLLELEDGPQCCGHGGLFHLAHPRQSDNIFTDLFTKVSMMKPDVVVTTCSGCLMQWQMKAAKRGASFQVMHLSVLLSKHLR